MNYLEMLKEKCNLSDEFMNIIYEIFDKLLTFGYITKKQIKNLEKKLYNNIDVVIIGDQKNMDYKTGYYDSIKKELYLKDITNISSVYLRIIYILTTTEMSKNSYSVGYSTAEMSKMNYKIIHKNFGLNRAVVSNLVCRLLYTLPATLSIIPTYRTYENDFLGNKITSENDIYFLEGKLLSQLCYILNLSEENLYINIFISPNKYLSKFFNKAKFKNASELLELFDDISRNYSNYNKLIFLNKELNDNYISIRKLLNEDSSELLKKQEKINSIIKKSLLPLLDNIDDENDDLFINIESSLSEKITELEEHTNKNIIKMQDIFVNLLISLKDDFSTIEYIVKQKELDRLLIIQNDNLKDSIYHTIYHKLLQTSETTSTNLIEKMKYSIINEILSNDKYVKIYKNMMFRKLNGLKLSANNAIMAIIIDSTFMQLVLVDSLNKKTPELLNNTYTLKLTSLGYILNNPSSTKDIHIAEKVFTSIRNKFGEFNNIRIEKMYMTKVENATLIIIDNNDDFAVLSVEFNNDDVICKKIKLSEDYSIFDLGKSSNNLPVMYDKNKSPLKKLLTFITILFS